MRAKKRKKNDDGFERYQLSKLLCFNRFKKSIAATGQWQKTFSTSKSEGNFERKNKAEGNNALKI